MTKPISLAQQIEEAEREIKLRESAFQSYGRAGNCALPSVLILCHPSGMTRLRDVVEGRREQWLQRAEWVCCAAFQDCLGAQFFKLLDRVRPDWEKREINLERLLA
jgi:hypothetical protein